MYGPQAPDGAYKSTPNRIGVRSGSGPATSPAIRVANEGSSEPAAIWQ